MMWVESDSRRGEETGGERRAFRYEVIFIC